MTCPGLVFIVFEIKDWDWNSWSLKFIVFSRILFIRSSVEDERERIEKGRENREREREKREGKRLKKACV